MRKEDLVVIEKNVYVSYAREDQEYADAVLNYLENVFCFDCWALLRNGTIYDFNSFEVDNAIRSCNCVVLLYSKNSKESEQVMKEYEIAEGYGKSTILCKTDASELEGMFEFNYQSNIWINIADLKIDQLHKMALNVNTTIKETLRLQVEELKRIIISFNNGANPELIQILISEGEKLVKIYDNKSDRFKKKYIALAHFRESFYAFYDEIQKIIYQYNGDIENNNEKTDILLDKMFHSLCKCDAPLY
jgi:hypothetical protein